MHRAAMAVGMTVSSLSTVELGHGQAPHTFTQSIPGTAVTITMALAPEGTFVLGSPESEVGRDQDEGPQRTVSVEAFWVGIHEVTHDQFAPFRYRRLDTEHADIAGDRFDVDAVSRPSPPYEDPAHGLGDAEHPAAGMTQWAALQYARWLSFKTGRLYRLPTEAEWEYACRAGTTSAHSYGEDRELLADHAWFEQNSGDVTHAVGRKTANGWGIYDMMGNVAEWTLDEYDASFYAGLRDPASSAWARPTREHPRTVRGGAFDDAAAQLRCADRLESTLRWKRRDPQLPKSRWWNTDSPHVGFRLVTPARSYTAAEIEAYWTELLGS